MDEALQWSRLPVQKGDAVVEIGSAPGGACQRLLEGGLKVTGVDPSEMDASIKMGRTCSMDATVSLCGRGWAG